ncbi:MAG TPA: cob(I)yrinic acid a,c-diamide adenosyltransferase [Longimicrobiales bacterium]|nr:cob(I)yrinic acid a,c-diamide adenosyltransferase [Longimicrobiales bacterium]
MTSRIYTRTGDAGDTGLFGGGRVPKDHPRVEAYGTVDELNAALGVAAEAVSDAWIRARVAEAQPDLFVIGAILATPPAAPGRRAPTIPSLDDARVGELERSIDEAESELSELKAFVMPGGCRGGAALHLARTVCRRAERRVVALTRDGAAQGVPDGVVIYLNRLSDLLFSLARLENHRAGSPEREWTPGAGES